VKAKQELNRLMQDDRELVLQCALRTHIADPESLDAKIDVIGAQHQALWLRNRIEPYLSEFLSHDDAWLTRCLDRLLSSEGDDWAVRALLFSPATNLLRLAYERAPHAVYASVSSDLKGTRTESIGLASRWTGGVAVDYFGIGWNPESCEVTEVQYAKSVVLPQELRDPMGREPKVKVLAGQCMFGRWRTAKLPQGSWYSYEERVALPAAEDTERALDGLPEWAQVER
jgi:hypothetical protein